MPRLGLWIAFTAALFLLFIADLLGFARKARTPSLREAALWSAFWIAISLAFAFWLRHYVGSQSAFEFISGYLIEKSLSIDNLFVFVLIFEHFSITPQYQRRVLVWGILAALALRALLIAAGTAFIDAFSWSFYVLGAFLVYVALHLLLRKSQAVRVQAYTLLRWLPRILPTALEQDTPHFFVRRDGRWLATPLLFALVAVEGADLLFALDSIPAVFGVTHDPFIVFSSNACAVLGLRALYFVLAKWITQLRYLRAGVSMVLLFVGLKMLAGHWVVIPPAASLAVVVVLLAAASAASLAGKRPAPNLATNGSRNPQERK